jgi:hypothetical protein
MVMPLVVCISTPESYGSYSETTKKKILGNALFGKKVGGRAETKNGHFMPDEAAFCRP